MNDSAIGNPQSATPVDARIDQLGYVRELEKQFAEPLNAAVKAEMKARKLERLAGDRFSGLLVLSKSRWVDPAKFLKLYESGKISRAAFLDAISVQCKAAEKLIGQVQLDKMSTFSSPTPRLCVDRIKGVEIKLVDAIEQLALYVPAAADAHPT